MMTRRYSVLLVVAWLGLVSAAPAPAPSPTGSSVATIVDPTNPPIGVNIALAALGGRIVKASSASSDQRWRPANLHDGTPAGWASADGTPHDVVFAFKGDREALVTTVIIDAWTERTAAMFQDRGGVPPGPKFYLLPRRVEVWTSTESATAGFTQAAVADLLPIPVEHAITFRQPVRARFVSVRFVSSHGGGAYGVQAGEVKILESPDGPSIVADAPKNLALPSLGGVIVRFTSQAGYIGRLGEALGEFVGYLTDGTTETPGWRSRDGRLPQDIVFAFHQNAEALIERIVLHPKNSADPSTWIKRVAVAVSDHPLDGFREVGRFVVPREARAHAFPLNARARFLRLRILENHGTDVNTSLGEVELIEGQAAGYVSVLRRAGSSASSPTNTQGPPIDERDVVEEREPNNTSGEANPVEVGRWTKGRIDPLGEQDNFRLTPAPAAPSVLTIDLRGAPRIRASLTLSDAAGKTLGRFDPANASGSRALFSWVIDPGEARLALTEPPISVVLAMDMSGSLTGEDLDNLKQAVRGYVDQVQPTERLHLIRFSQGTEALTKDLTGNRDELKAALEAGPTTPFGTAFYDAVALGLNRLAQERGNRAVIVMSDGEDASSQLTSSGLWDLIAQIRIPIYTIGMGPELTNYESILGATPHRLMTFLSLATGGRFFYARSSDQLRDLYQQIALELRTTASYYFRPTLSRGSGRLAVAATGERLEAVSAPSQIELILDASGSMRRLVDGRPRIDVAKEVMAQIIKELPPASRVALRVYGHRIREGQRGDCQDSELVVPFGKIDKPAMLARVRAIRALGTTPIAYSLRQVPHDFGSAQGEKLVILVTDGKEECGGSPSAVVSDLVAKGIKMRLNIVGFALADAGTKQEMERVARLTGGRFFDAANAGALVRAIQESLAIPFEVLDAAGRRVSGGLTGQTVAVPEGVYTVVVQASGPPARVPNVAIAVDSLTKVVLRKEGQQIGIQVEGP